MATACPHVDTTAEDYVSGLLSEAEQSAFEEHFFECQACLAAVQRLQDVRASLAGSPAAAATGSVVPFERPGAARRFGRASAWTMLVAASVVALTGVGVWELRQSELPAASPAANSSSGPNTAPPGPIGAVPDGAGSPSPSPPTAPANPLAPLALVVAPTYAPMTTRAARDDDARAFEAAMTDYSRERYRRAVQQLEPLAKRSPGFAPAQFFLGISLLMVGEDGAARGPLTRCIDLAVPPYSDEAHFYLAKSALRLGEIPAAERELQAAIARDAGPDGEAARLLRALRALPR